MATYKNKNLLTLIESDSNYEVQYLNQSISGLFGTQEIELLNNENTCYVYFSSLSDLFDINFSGSFDRTNWFFLEPDNGNPMATPPYSRPHIWDTSALNIDNSGATTWCMLWKFSNCPKYLKWYNPVAKNGVSVWYKTLKNGNAN